MPELITLSEAAGSVLWGKHRENSRASALRCVAFVWNAYTRLVLGTWGPFPGGEAMVPEAAETIDGSQHDSPQAQVPAEEGSDKGELHRVVPAPGLSGGRRIHQDA